jgi:membrane dipeptidase
MPDHDLPVLVDAHEDLAWNMLTFGRDYTRSAAATREHERATRSTAIEYNGDTLLGWPDYQAGRVAVVFSTLFAAPVRRCLGDWDRNCYRDLSQARSIYRAQLDAYHRLVEKHPELYRLIEVRRDLDEVLSGWQQPPRSAEQAPQVGLVALMEGAEAVGEPAELEEWWARGVRIVGPAWAGTRFCGGTGEPGPLTGAGFALLEAMAGFGFFLDVSHMDEKAALQALDSYDGRVIASHANLASLLRGAETNRHLTDDVVAGLLERDGIIGVVPFNTFLKVGWRAGDRRSEATLEDLVAHVDAICQRAGDARHVGIGSDFDGGFGWQSVPEEINTIADLRKIGPLLEEKGYSQQDIARIFGQNWISMLKEMLPESV